MLAAESDALRGAELAVSGRYSPRRPLPPADGKPPSAEQLLTGALMWASPDVTAVLVLVRDDDIESCALAEVVAAIRRLHSAGRPHDPALVLAELQRTGRVRRYDGVAGQLQAATTSGADPLAAREYAAAVVAGALRRRLDSAGVALQQVACEAAEDGLSSEIDLVNRMLGDTAERLARLRGSTA